jgi:hypothetical protein
MSLERDLEKSGMAWDFHDWKMWRLCQRGVLIIGAERTVQNGLVRKIGERQCKDERRLRLEGPTAVNKVHAGHLYECPSLNASLGP